MEKEVEYTWNSIFYQKPSLTMETETKQKTKPVKQKKSKNAAPTLSEDAKEAISWFFDDAPDKMTIKEMKEFIAAKWGCEVNEEIKDFFCI